MCRSGTFRRKQGSNAMHVDSAVLPSGRRELSSLTGAVKGNRSSQGEDRPLKHLLIISGLVTALAGCTASMSPDAPGLEPIPGSITYGGQPRTDRKSARLNSSH